MKIDGYFKKAEAPGSALGANRAGAIQKKKGEPASAKSKRAAPSASPERDTRATQDRGAGDQQPPCGQAPAAAAGPDTPLLEAGGQQQRPPMAAAQQLPPPAEVITRATPEPAIDLCDDEEPPQQQEQQEQHEQQGQEQQGQEQDLAAPEVAAAATAAGEAATPARAAAAPAPAGKAGDCSPMATPVAAARGADAGAAAPPSAAKAGAEAFLTAEQREQLLGACVAELPLLEAQLDVRPDLSGELAGASALSSGKKAQLADLKHQISALVEGQALPLTQLAERIAAALGGGGGSGRAGEQEGGAGSGGGVAVEPLVVRNVIQDVASRRSYGLQDAALLAGVDALEDATPAHHWCWELRSLVGLPKGFKQRADFERKQRKAAHDRLRAVAAFVQLARAHKPTKTAEAKLARAAAKLGKLRGARELQDASTSAAAAVDRAKQDQIATAAQAKAADAEEKARTKQQEAEKREAARRSKAAEAAQKKEEAEAARKGFGSAQSMHKSQNVIKHFFSVVPRAPSPAKRQASAETSQGAGSQHDGGGGGSLHGQAGKDPQRTWAPPGAAPSEQQLALMRQLEGELPYCGGGASAAVASAAPADGVDSAAAAVCPLPDLLGSLQRQWRAVRLANSRVWGMPPSWARRPGADSDRGAAAAPALGGADRSEVRCWRRKLVSHHDSVRPAFYGSCSRMSRSVSGRRPLGRDAELDYEVMSDQDWEEEPEGESLSVNGDEEEEEAGGTEAGEEDEEGFVVGDGYLSEDEGMRDEGDEAGQGARGPAAGSGSDGPEQPELAQLEAALDRARARNRPLVLVHECAPMAWEATSGLEPALLSSLAGSLLRRDVLAAPVAPHDLPHLFGAPRPAPAGAAPVAASAAAAACGADAAGQAAAAAAAGPGAAAVGSGGRGRKPTMFPPELLPALVRHVHNSTQPVDKLVASFVDAHAGSGFLVSKVRVRDKVREIATMRMVGKAPHYTVKPELLAPAGGEAPQGDAMQVDAAQQQPQQQQQQGSPCPDPAGGSGAKRAATEPAAAGGEGEAASAEQGPGPGQQRQPPPPHQQPNPPAKKHRKSTPGSGITRFFGPGGKAATQQQQQQQQQQEPAQQPAPPQQQRQQQDQEEEQQQERRQDSPPSTPRDQRVRARIGSPAQAGWGSAAGGGAAGGGQYSGAVLPMLTPPSDVADHRPAAPSSPVPFRLGTASGGEQAGGAPMPAAAAAAGQPQALGFDQPQGDEPPPPPQQQQQPGPEQQPGQQQEPAGAGAPAASGGSSAPELPTDGEPPSTGFWRQLASWIVGAKQPAREQLESALAVFDERRLPECLPTMPQVLLSAMVKTLGSSSSSLAMRSACARCISNTVQCLSSHEVAGATPSGRHSSPARQQQQEKASSPAAGAPPPSAKGQRASPPQRSGEQAAAAAPLPSPSPGSSPRSAPIEASFEEVCAEPGLLPNLRLCMSPDKCLEAARAAGGGSSQREARELAESATRALATLLKVGVGERDGDSCPETAAAAAAQLRIAVASDRDFRGALKKAVRLTDSTPLSTYALMALHALLSDPAAASQLLPNERLARLLFNTCAVRGGADGCAWPVQKWALLVAREMLDNTVTRGWVLWEGPPAGLAQSNMEQLLETLEGAAQMAAAVAAKVAAGGRLREPGPARSLLAHCVKLSGQLADHLACMAQCSRGRLPQRMAALLQEEAASEQGGDGTQRSGAIFEAACTAAQQGDWEEGAEIGRETLAAVRGCARAVAAGAAAGD